LEHPVYVTVLSCYAVQRFYYEQSVTNRKNNYITDHGDTYIQVYQYTMSEIRQNNRRRIYTPRPAGLLLRLLRNDCADTDHKTEHTKLDQIQILHTQSVTPRNP